MADERVVVGRVRRAHGLRGEILVHPETDHPEAVFAGGRTLLVHAAGGQVAEVEVASMRPHKGGYLLTLVGVADRTAAEALAGRELLVLQDALEPLAGGEIFVHDLVGVEVVDVEGAVIGRVRQVFLSEPADLLEVRRANGTVLVPFTRRIVREIDLDAGRVVIEPPEGLLEL
ncbi:MAG: ribosome maturation factor RimM [Longimicrobiales bacterium]